MLDEHVDDAREIRSVPVLVELIGRLLLVALLLAFGVIEARTAAPLLPLRIFRLPTVAVANAVGLLLGGSFFGFIFIGTLYMQQVLHYSALQAGIAWLAASVTSFNIVIIVGMGSLVGAFVGGLLVSVAESLGAVFLKPSLKEVVSFSLLIVILLFRPAGLFGKRAP